MLKRGIERHVRITHWCTRVHDIRGSGELQMFCERDARRLIQLEYSSPLFYQLNQIAIVLAVSCIPSRHSSRLLDRLNLYHPCCISHARKSRSHVIGHCPPTLASATHCAWVNSRQHCPLTRSDHTRFGSLLVFIYTLLVATVAYALEHEAQSSYISRVSIWSQLSSLSPSADYRRRRVFVCQMR
jgi:hypothetical protein